MATTTMEERLAAVGRHLDELESRARAAPVEARPRIERHLDALRGEVASTGAAVEAEGIMTETAVSEHGRAIEDRLDQLDKRVEIAGHSLAADLARDLSSFTYAVADELEGWGAYLDELGAKAERQQFVAELRQRRDTLAERLAEARAASGERWDEQKQRVVAAREELEQKADELGATLR